MYSQISTISDQEDLDLDQNYGKYTGPSKSRVLPTFQTTKEDDQKYMHQRNNWLKECFIKDHSTKVKVVKPTQLRSFRLLKEAEALLLAADG